MPIGAASILRLPSRHSVLGVVTDIDAGAVRPAATRLQSIYRSVPDFPGAVASSISFPGLRAGLVVVARAPVELAPDTVVVWGAPLGGTGPATADELEAVLRDPERVVDLGGVFVLARSDGRSLRLVSSTDFVYTLRRAGNAFATKAIAALSLAGMATSVDRGAVCERLGLASVIATGEVLAGVAACEEGSVVEITASTVTTAPAVSLGDRLAHHAPPTPAGFRDALSAWMTRAGRLPDVVLGLTAGRDSALLASCVGATGAGTRTLTYASASFADNRGAEAVARLYGLEHERLGVTYPDGRAISRWRHPTIRVPGDDVVGYLVRHAAWCEGMQHPRDALVGHLSRPAGDIATITGHSGEVARAYYWRRLPDGPLVETFVEHGPAWHLPDIAKERIRQTVAAEVTLATEAGRPDDALDLMLARRQSAWMPHTQLAGSPFTDVLPAYLSAEACRMMLDVPLEQRRTGSFFEAALALDGRDVYGVATRAAATPGWAARLGRLNPYKLPNDLQLLWSVMAAFEPDGWLVRDILGEKWWRWALDAAPSLPAIRGVLWSSVGIEALHRWPGATALRD